MQRGFLLVKEVLSGKEDRGAPFQDMVIDTDVGLRLRSGGLVLFLTGQLVGGHDFVKVAVGVFRAWRLPAKKRALR